MLKSLVLLVVIVGCIISVIIEIPKRFWKKKHVDLQFPAWIAMSIGGVLSVLFAILVYLLFKGYPSLSMLVLDGTNALVVVPYSVVFFLAQYFISMEVVKRVVNGFLKIAGIAIKE